MNFNYGVTGTTKMGLGSGNPFERAAAQDNAFAYQKQHDQDMFERSMMQQEQQRRGQETANQRYKYSVLGNLLKR